MLKITIVLVAILFSVHAFEGCEQLFEESSTLRFTPQGLENVEDPSKPCCLPDQLQGGLWLKSMIKLNRGPRDEVDADISNDAMPDKRGRRKPLFINAAGCYAVDYSKGRMRVNEVGITSDKKRFNVSLIVASDVKSMFIIDWQSQKCFVRSFPYGVQQCLPTNATLLAQPYFGLAGESSAGLQVNIYGNKFATKDACGGMLLLVTTNKCVPFVTEYELHTKAMSKYTSLTYHDEQATVSDPTTFNPPSFCHKSPQPGEDVNDEELPHLIKHFMLPNY